MGSRPRCRKRQQGSIESDARVQILRAFKRAPSRRGPLFLGEQLFASFVGGRSVSKQFDPPPFDKYAADPNEAAKADRKMSERLKSGLVGSFPASDPASIS